MNILHPILHSAPIWNPYLTKDINSLESVQRLAIKVCLKQWNTPYCQLLNQSHLPDLSTHHKHFSLCYFYNIVEYSLTYHYSPQHLLHNTHSFMQFSAPTNCFQHFFPHTYGTPYLVLLTLHHLFFFLNYFHSLQCVYGHMYHISVLSLFMCTLNSDKTSLKHCLFEEEPPSCSSLQYWTSRGCNLSYLTKNHWFKPNWLVSRHI